MSGKQVFMQVVICVLSIMMASNMPSSHLAPATTNDTIDLPSYAEHLPDVGWATLLGAFEENIGQFHEDVRFLLRGYEHNLWIAADGALWLTSHVPDTANNASAVTEPGTTISLRLSFEGAVTHPQIDGVNPMQTTVSYFRGTDAKGWHTYVPLWQAVRITGLLPGLVFEMWSDGSTWGWALKNASANGEQDSVGVDELQLVVEGAQQAAIVNDELRIVTELGALVVPGPEALVPLALITVLSDQPTNIGINPAQLAGAGIQPIMDLPTALDNPSALRFSTFLGGAVDDYGTAITVDGAGRVYVAGLTTSPAFPTTTGAFDRTHNGNQDVFVARLNRAGTALEYATFIGGSGNDYAGGIAVDGAGRIYVVGSTESSDFPVVSGSFDMTHNGAQDVFVLRLAPGGTALQYSTFLGGAGQDAAEALAVDAAGRAYVTGYTRSASFPTTAGAFDTTYNGGSDAFVIRLNATGSTLEYATYLGGGSDDYAFGIAIDASGQAYVAGATASSNFPTTPGAFDTSFNGNEDAFALRLNPSGSALAFGTFLGGSGADRAVGIAVDAQSRSYVTGFTASANFPVTTNSFDPSYNGGGDVFILRLNSLGSSLEYGAFLGGSSQERSFSVAVDSNGRANVAGSTRSTNFPVTGNAFDVSYNGGVNDAFLARVSSSGGLLEYATYLGGAGNDEAYAVALDANGDLLVTGFTNSVGFPTTLGAYDTSHNGRDDVFVAHLAMPTSTPTATPTPTHTPTPTPTNTAARRQYTPLLLRNFGPVSTATPTPTHTPTPVPNDPYEPNDTPQQAWGPLVSGQVYRALIYGPQDHNDFYWFEMLQAHPIHISLEQIPSGHDYHLYLYTSSLVQVGYSGNLGNQSEYIVTGTMPAGRYYVRVQRVVGYSATEQYALRATYR